MRGIKAKIRMRRTQRRRGREERGTKPWSDKAQRSRLKAISGERKITAA